MGNKKRKLLMVLAILTGALFLCDFGLVPDIAELKVTKPFIELDLMVKESVGTNGAEAVITDETEAALIIAPGTDAKEESGEIIVEVHGTMIRLDGVYFRDDFEGFSKKFLEKYNRGMKVRFVDDYADAEVYRKVLSLFNKYEITSVREKNDK